MPTIKAMDLGDLEDGQGWDDALTVTMTRHQWHVALAVCSKVMDDIEDGLADATRQARRGDAIAGLVGMALADTHTDIRHVALHMMEVANPKLYAEVVEKDKQADVQQGG